MIWNPINDKHALPARSNSVLAVADPGSEERGGGARGFGLPQRFLW